MVVPVVAVLGVASSLLAALGAHPGGTRAATDFRVSIALGGTLISLLAAGILGLWVRGRHRSAERVATARGASRLAAQRTTLEGANRELGTARDVAAAESQAKSEFLSTMSHEIRTPMNAVIGLTEIVLDGELDPEQREHLETIRRSGDALLALINDILDWSKIEAGALKLDSSVFNIRDCVEDVVHSLASEVGNRDLDLLIDMTPDCPPVAVGDVNRLRQVLVNLVGNAIKFTQQGHVVVTASRQPQPDPGSDPGSDADVSRQQTPVGAPGADRRRFGLRIVVADTGIGVAQNKMDRLFRDFSQVETSITRRYGGSGLGLAISHRLAAAMGGRITVTSAVGVGSTFTADLCFAIPDPGEIPPRATTPAALPGCRALVVDDNAVNRSILSTQLAGWGITSTVADSGEQALELLQGGAQFDIGLFDYHMPGIDGLALLDRLATLPAVAGLPVIMLSSMTERGLVKAAAHPPDRHLTKPVRSAALRDSLADILGRTTPRIPYATIGSPAPTAAHAEDYPAHGRMLVVDDNAVNLAVASLMLKKLGYPVDVATDGQAALDNANRTPYTAIFMDLQMPIMDGLEATRRLRQTPPPGPRPWIIALTAGALVEDRDACQAAGMDDYLIKPVRREQIADALTRIPHLTTSANRTNQQNLPQ